MSHKLAAAESALVSKLEISRNQQQLNNDNKPAHIKKLHNNNNNNNNNSNNNNNNNNNENNNKIKKEINLPNPPITNDENEVKAVLNLEVPRIDKTRTFQGIEKQKIAKKDRHIQALDEFAKNLEVIAEEIEMEVLATSRDIRDNLEQIDNELKIACNLWKNNDYLVAMSSDELDIARVELKNIIDKREKSIELFAQSLEGLECKRADIVGNKIKTLVDTLIGIAHQLPDEIEHIVETEAYDLNTVLTKNRKAHAELLGVMRIKQVEIEVSSLHEWDVAKLHWRKLRHEQAIRIFHENITSTPFIEPKDRQDFMENIRIGQTQRQKIRQDCLNELSKLSSETITISDVTKQQQTLLQINEDELSATQDCYNGLSELRVQLRKKAENRMEELRIELHQYGALCEEPPLIEISNQLKLATNSNDLSELWRLGGGLKSDINSVSNDFCSVNMYYETFLNSVQTRLELLVCGFNLKEVLNERGRLPRLDIVRNLLSKVRTVPRNEVSGILTNLLADFKEMSILEKMPLTFQHSLTLCIEGIEKELNRIIQDGTSTPASGTSRDTTILTKKTLNETSGIGTGVGTMKSGRRTTARTMKTSNLIDTEKSGSVIDPNLVKQWTRTLGILYYGCDIPDEYKNELNRALSAVKQQKNCNDYVDIAIRDECDYELDRLDLRYKRMLDAIVNFLELQTSSITYSTNQITEFYLKIADIMEKHKKKQHTLDEASLDALWDYKEDNRLACEERENDFQEACKILRRSADMTELQKNFEIVLNKLDNILENYRTYHGKACFIADQYPITLIDDYVDHMMILSKQFHMEPIIPHKILEEQQRLHDTNKRLNKKYLEQSTNISLPTEQILQSNDENVTNNNKDNNNNNTTNTTNNTEYVEKFYIEEILPPRSEEDDDNINDNDDDIEFDPAPHRKYGLLIKFQDFVNHFIEETSNGDDESEINNNGNHRLRSGSEDISVSGSISDNLNGVTVGITEKINPNYPWLVMKIYPGQDEPPMITLLNEESLKRMEPDEIESYEENIAKYFVLPNETLLLQINQSSSSLPLPNENESSLINSNIDSNNELTFPSLKLAYEETCAILERVKSRKQQRTPKYLRENPPKDSRGKSFALKIEISYELLSTMLQDLRISLFHHLEMNAHDRIEQAEALTKKQKHELTEELEDLLRTHWPRSGLVETQIKRPREVELLNHEEKTYRFIISIQEKMSALQSKFEDEIKQAELCCDNFTKDIDTLVNQLSDVQFKTLASLQGIEVKARTLTQTFTGKGNVFLTNLRQMVAEDASSIIVYARDFRKICPPQEDGKESGGYSPEELEEIGVLVEGQCHEISEILNEWRESIIKVENLFSTTATNHGIFTNKYDQVANDLALSQGLGQKYGAPRRRAQERLRTEISRDEQCAGKLDELIALLDFSCSEAVRKCEAVNTSTSFISLLLQGKEITSLKLTKELGYEEMRIVDEMWDLSIKVRSALYDRAVYLSVLSDPSEESPCDINWINVLSHLPPLQNNNNNNDNNNHNRRDYTNLIPITSSITLHNIVNEVEKDCINETKELYTKEGKGELLKETVEGIPESLSIWLKETRQKILGPNGHHEKAWKKLWNQISTFELLFGRKTGPMDQPQTRVGIPAACFRVLCYGYEQFITQLIDIKVEQFLKLLKVFEKCKEKHERQLRPRLGSPDALNELLELDKIEGERSNDIRQNIQQFQSNLLTLISKYSKIFCEDLGLCGTAFIKYLDTSLRLDLIQVPPDTEIPKKKMTLKRLRKAQRVQEAVKRGAEDTSSERIWPPLSLEFILQAFSKAEPLILLEDLQSLVEVIPPPVVEPVPTTTPGKALKGKKKVEPVEVAPVVTHSGRPELISEYWLQQIREKSSIRGEVSTAHRLLIGERDNSLQRYAIHMTTMIDENKIYYGKILQQEDSWNERWRTQVEMLKQGNL